VLVCTRYLCQLYQYRCPLLAVDYYRYRTSCIYIVTCSRFCASNAHRQEKQAYLILLILTDGTINDLDATKVRTFCL
jgi:dissimilatory sulfite reductase (desulfoviridin) alpha/beta subunit